MSGDVATYNSQQTALNETPSFNGCCLSLQLNGLNILTVDHSDDIKAILSFIARKENKRKAVGR